MYKSIFFFVVFRCYTEKNILRLLNHLNYLKKINPKKKQDSCFRFKQILFRKKF